MKFKISIFISIILIFFLSSFLSLLSVDKIIVLLILSLMGLFILCQKINYRILFIYLVPLLFLKTINFLYYILIFILFFIIIFNFIKTKKILIPYPIFLVFLFIASIIGLAEARVFNEGIEYFNIYFVIPSVMIIFINNIEFSLKEIHLLLRNFIVISVILAVIGIYLAIITNERVGSLWITAMTINAFYMMFFFITVGFLLISKNKIKSLFLFSVLLIIFAGMIFTYTRMALLGAIFGLFLIFIKIKYLRKIGLYFLIFSPVLIPPELIGRIALAFHGDVSILIRIVAWYYSYGIIKDHPLFGIGFNTFFHWYKNIVPLKILYAEHPHNLYIRILVEMGLFGFISYFSLIFVSIKDYYKSIDFSKSYSSFSYSLIISLVSVLFSCLTDVFVSHIQIAIPFWIMVSILIKLNSKNKQELLIEF